MDYSINDGNDTIIDDFIYQIDLSIETGDINYIKKSLIKYRGLLNETYIKWANTIMIQITQEQITEMTV